MATPGLFVGASAIEELGQRAVHDDPQASSHWQKYHSDFRYDADRFHGLGGFGSLERRAGLRRALHRLFLKQYRRRGSVMEQFPRLDDLMAVIARRQGRVYGLDAMRQTLSLASVLDRLPPLLAPDCRAGSGATVGVIGDGFGVLASLVLASNPRSRVVLVNLTKTLLVDLVFARRALPGLELALIDDEEGLQEALSLPIRVLAIEASRSSLLGLAPLDLAFNIVSMQEMDPPAIASYFNSLRSVAACRDVYFYCCNRVSKVLPDDTETRFEDYPWSTGDLILFDEPCPWHQTFYAFRPPFIRRYDGPVQHRLVKMAAA